MSDDDDKYRDFSRTATAKCKLCKKKETYIVGNERCDRMVGRLDARARNIATMTRVEVDQLRKQRDHVEKVRKGLYCQRCIESLDLWIL